jgi:hypothetical protein
VRWSRALLIVGATFLPFVTWDNLYHGQVDFMLLVLVTGGLWLISRDRQIAGGVLLWPPPRTSSRSWRSCCST